MKKRIVLSTLLVFAALLFCTFAMTLGALAAEGRTSESDLDFKAKMSVTLDSELVCNIYVPNKACLKSFTVDGETAENAELVSLDDGGEYYLVEVAMPACEAAREISVEAILTVDSQDSLRSFTFSIPKYAAEVIESYEFEQEADLVLDALSYIRAAYAYFGADDAEAIADIDALLGEGYDENRAPALDGSDNAPEEGLVGAALVLDAVPAIRFYLPDGADSSLYSFYSDGELLKAEEGIDSDGRYIELSVYAYNMGKTFSYTIDGENAGDYHLKSYHTFVTTDEEYADNAELISLVERFAKYCESAEAYREKMISVLECEHSFTEGECTKCGKSDPDYVPDFGTMTLTAPSVIYSNYPAKELSVSFSKPNYSGEVTYTTSNPNVFVEDGKIYATGSFASETDVLVTATTEHHTASATVKVSTYQGGISVETKVQYYEKNIIKEENKGGMIFVGDSYFDGYTIEKPPFWKQYH